MLLHMIGYSLLFSNYMIVDGDSMLPSLSDKQVIYVKDVDTYMSINRGDIVVFKSPYSDYRDVKRVIAVSGDKVSIEKNVHRVNSEIVVKPYVDKDTPSVIMRKEFTVPENSLYVLGDNFYNSIDSRYYGFVKYEDVVGVVKGCEIVGKSKVHYRKSYVQ